MSNLMEGGWNFNEDAKQCDLPQNVAAAFNKAKDGLVGMKLEPVLYVGKQVVQGTNYCIICKTKTITREPETDYKTLYVYEDLDGNAHITRIEEVV